MKPGHKIAKIYKTKDNCLLMPIFDLESENKVLTMFLTALLGENGITDIAITVKPFNEIEKYKEGSDEFSGDIISDISVTAGMLIFKLSSFVAENIASKRKVN